MSDLFDENKDLETAAEREDGLLIIFPDDNDDQDSDDNDGESFSLSFGKVNAAKKEEEFSYLPFLNIPEVVDEDEDDDDSGESFSLSFGKVSAAKKEQDYVYLPFLNVDENVSSDDEEDDDKEEDDDSGIDIVGGDSFFDLTPLKTKDTDSSLKRQKSKSSDKSSGASANSRKPQVPKKGKTSGGQKKKMPAKNGAPQKPNKVQQIMAQMDPDIIASVSADPRQMIMLEETIRSELIKQAAHNAVAKELGVVEVEVREAPKKRQASSERSRQPEGKMRNSAPGLSFARQNTGNKNSRTVSIADTSTISEFGAEAPSVQPAAVQNPMPKAQPQVQTQAPQIKNVPSAAPIVTQPVIVQQPVQSAPTQTPSQTQSTASSQSTQRKPYTPTSPAAIRAAMKSGAMSFDTPSESSSESSSGSTQNRKRLEIQKQIGEKRSGCVIGAIALLMVVFVGIIALISGGDIMEQCGYNKLYSRAEELVAKGNYNNAIVILEDIKGYSQTASLLNKCYYEVGKKEQDAGNYEAAIEYYNKTVDYEDAVRSRIDLQILRADEYAADAEKEKNAEQYLKAFELYSGMLEELEKYPKIASDTESEEIKNKSNSARFEYAKLLYNSEKYADAKGHLENLKNISYADSDTWYYNTCYNLGCSYFTSGNYISAEDELSVFIEEKHGLDSASYAKATAYLALSGMYSIQNMQNEDTQSIEKLFALLMKANESELDDKTLKEVRSAMTSAVFDRLKLNGIWKSDDSGSVKYDGSKITLNIANQAANGIAEISSEEIRFENGNVIISVNGSEYTVLSSMSFDSTYQKSPQTLTFVNPYDNQVYTMYRNG